MFMMSVLTFITMMTILTMILMIILMMILMMVGAGTEDQSWEEPYTFAPLFPAPGGVRTTLWDLDPVWERERERVNRDALTRLKTPGGVGELCGGQIRRFPPWLQLASLMSLQSFEIDGGRRKVACGRIKRPHGRVRR